MLVRYSTEANGRLAKKALVYTQSEHGIPPDAVDRGALSIVKKLREKGYESYIVGGAVRDLLCGKKPKDFDIVTDALPGRIRKIFTNARIIGRRFRLVHVYIGDAIYEVCTFRSSEHGSIGNEYGSSMDEDVRRRDFTMNALYYDPVKNQVIDFVGGVQDLRRRVLRPVIPLDRIFEEDPVRMLRAVKYSATCGCRIPFALRRKIASSAPLLAPVSQSRLTEEIIKIINSSHAYDIIRAARDAGLFKYLQNACAALMARDASFEASYLASMKALDAFVLSQPDGRLWERLSYMLRDFVARTFSPEGAAASQKAAPGTRDKVFDACKAFILPMCPPNRDLQSAVDALLREHGITASSGARTASRRGRGRPSTSEKDSPANPSPVVNSVFPPGFLRPRQGET